MRQIVPGLYSFTGLIIGRVYLLEDPDGLTIIDAGIERSADLIIRQLVAAGHSPQDVKQILITHAHPDHIGGLPKLQRATGAQVIASAEEQPIIEGRIAIPTPPRENLPVWLRPIVPTSTILPGTPVGRLVSHREILPLFGGLRVLHTPGHTAGHLSFWQPERRLLFCGDVIMRLPNMRLPFAGFSVDIDENRRSVHSLASLEPNAVMFGHGEPLLINASQRIKAFAASL